VDRGFAGEEHGRRRHSAARGEMRMQERAKWREGGATKGLGLEKKGEGACTGASHNGREVAAGRCSGRGGAAWRTRKKARGEGLGRRLAWGRHVGAARGRRWRRQSCSGDERRWPAAQQRGKQRKKKRGGRQGLM
jgi:hypothetical protein